MNNSSYISDIDPFDVLFEDSSFESRPIFQNLRPSPINSNNNSTAGKAIDSPSSADSEFGSFVSVSAADDPLQPSVGEKNDAGRGDGQLIDFKTEPLHSTSYFGKFAEEAKERTRRNERRVMDDLRGDEEDPLGWRDTGVVSSSPTQKEAHLDRPPDTIMTQEELTTLDNMEIGPTESGKLLVELPGPQESSKVPTPPSFSLPRTASDSSIHQARARSRSPPPGNISFGSSLSRSWMSSLLSSTRASPARTSSPRSSPVVISRSSSTDGDSEGTSTPMSPTETKLHELFMKSQHVKTMPPTSSTVPTVRRVHRQATDGFSSHIVSPFASHPYIPPSGAPGFAGDREWNTAGFDFDSRHQVKTVSLAGRKGLTTPVLDVDLANAVCVIRSSILLDHMLTLLVQLRPHLPALARLPNTWTLLYSLDQHGISLNTLYSRCTIPPGGKAPGSTGSLLVAQDAEGGVFGAWVSEGIHLSHGSYYGGGDSSVSRVLLSRPNILMPNFSFLWSRRSRHADSLEVFKWSGRNDYVALCDTDSISFGGGFVILISHSTVVC